MLVCDGLLGGASKCCIGMDGGIVKLAPQRHFIFPGSVDATFPFSLSLSLSLSLVDNSSPPSTKRASLRAMDGGEWRLFLPGSASKRKKTRVQAA